MSQENQQVELEQRVSDLEFLVLFQYLLYQTDIKRKIIESQTNNQRAIQALRRNKGSV